MDKCKKLKPITKCDTCGHEKEGIEETIPCDKFRESVLFKNAYQFVVDFCLSINGQTIQINYCPFCGEKLK